MADQRHQAIHHRAREDRAVILVDGNSLFKAASVMQIEIDYEKLLRFLVGDRKLMQALFYTGANPGNQKQMAFLRWMRNHGYRVVQKELTQAPDGSRSADLSVEIAIDLLRMAELTETIVLVTQDEQLLYAAQTIVRNGVLLELVGLRNLSSEHLVNLADRFIDLALIQSSIQRRPASL
jgi:uncharacterized LabA/DUF88 family protein